MAVPPVYMERSTAGDHEVFEDTDRELQNLVRLEMQWASSFGNANLVDQRRLSCGFCLNSLDIPFVRSVGMNWKD